VNARLRPPASRPHRLGERPDPAPAAGQALIRVHGAGAGLWDVGFLSGGFPGIALPFVPGQEVAGIVEAVGDGAGVQPGERVYASLFLAGGGFAELAVASADRLAPMPAEASFQEAAGLVVAGGTAYEGLVDRGRLQAGQTVLITAAAGGVGSVAVQIAAAIGARSPANRSPLTSTGSGWRHCAAWSMPAHCAPRSRRCCHWNRPARHCGGSRAGTPAARSCCGSGSSGGASERCYARRRCPLWRLRVLASIRTRLSEASATIVTSTAGTQRTWSPFTT